MPEEHIELFLGDGVAYRLCRFCVLQSYHFLIFRFILNSRCTSAEQKFKKIYIKSSERHIISCVQMKYKTEIGESMVKPNEKLKRILLITGVTGVVYASFKYLLPLVIPFFIAYVIALGLYPTASCISRKMSFQVGKKNLHIPVGIVGALELLILLSVAGIWIYAGAQRLYIESRMLVDQVPIWISQLDLWLTGKCRIFETALSLKPGCLVVIVRDMLRGLGNSVKNGAMPYLMSNSMAIFQGMIQITVIWVVGLVSIMLSLQEMEELKYRRDNSIFHEEFTLISQRLKMMGNAYVKTQGLIMILTTAICITGLFLMKNPYYILAGIGIGLLDALPIFGTGTVFIPWVIIALFQGQVGTALTLMAIYLICYFLREIMEARMMGNKVGLSALETLVSMYVGLKLFGVLGFILGPVGLLLIEDFVNLYKERDSGST